MSATSYYIVAVDPNGDVMAAPATLRFREGLNITVHTSEPVRFAFENQGEGSESVWEAARDALASIMPDADE